MAVEFRMLGDVEAHRDGRPVELGHARQRCVLAALLVDANRPVPAERLMDRVWGDRLPQRARNALAGYLSRLRAALGDDVAITREPGGYRLAVDPDAIDLHRFRRLVDRARRRPHRSGDAGAGGSPDAAALLDEALALWRGEPLATLDSPWATALRSRLAADRLAAELERTDLALARGEHAALLPALTARAATQPLDERVAGQLMRALYGCGRQADALRHYDGLRRRLADELGIDPGPALRRLHRDILTAELPVPAPLAPAAPTPAPPAPTAATPAPPAAGPPGPEPAAAGPAAPVPEVPRQLPAPPPGFAGRAAHLAELDALLAATAAGGRPVAVAAVSGMAGVGKTTLALEWAHRVTGRFPDGQLYVNLRGFDPAGPAMTATDALRGFLDALGVPPQRTPGDLAARSALYRSLLAGRRVLVVLDNARDAEQVRPLLPGSPGSVAVVTSRDRLTGLVATGGARPLSVGLLAGDEARHLLAGRLGERRVAAEPAAVAEIVERCGHLPLALAVVAARAATHPDFTLASLAAELRAGEDRPGGRLDPLDGGDPAADVRRVFSWSYHALGAPAARLFRLLGLHPGPQASAASVASLTALPVPRARALLAQLARAHLVAEPTPGRFAFHDLLRAYALEQAQATDPPPVRSAATRRLLDHYLHTAYAADRLLYPHRDPIVLPDPDAGVTPEPVAGNDAAMAWFVREHRVLFAAVDQAVAAGFDEHVSHLAWSLTTYVNLRGYWADQIEVQTTALAAARRRGEESAQAHAHRNLGRAYTMLGRRGDAREHLRRALELFAAVGDRPNEAQVHVNLGRVLEQEGRHDEAIAHDERSYELYRAARHLAGQARALNNLGFMRARRAGPGDVEQADELCRQSLSLHEQLGNRHGAATAWHSLGYAHHRAGRHGRAVACLGRALEMFREVGDHAGEADALLHLGDAHHAAGDSVDARRAWTRALDLLEPAGHPDAALARARLSSGACPARAGLGLIDRRLPSSLRSSVQTTASRATMPDPDAP